MLLMWGIHRWPVNSPHKGTATRKCFHLMTSPWSYVKSLIRRDKHKHPPRFRNHEQPRCSVMCKFAQMYSPYEMGKYFINKNAEQIFISYSRMPFITVSKIWYLVQRKKSYTVSVAIWSVASVINTTLPCLRHFKHSLSIFAHPILHWKWCGSQTYLKG